MQIFDAALVEKNLPYEKLIEALDIAFRGDVTVPQRGHYTLPIDGGSDATLLLMPAWVNGGTVAVKIASVFPDNARYGKGAVNASVLLLDGETGEARAIVDGGELTLRRTACASALAARYLARTDAKKILMIGTGNLAPHLVAAHSTVRHYDQVRIWGRDQRKASAMAENLGHIAADVRMAGNLEQAVREADLVCCATLAATPLIRGAWLRPGQHIDLVGAYTPEMREADSEALSRAQVYVDTRSGALAEAGDILLAIRDGAMTQNDIRAELAELARGARSGRQSGNDITLFKSVGTALEDLAAAELCVAGGGSD